MSKVALAIGLAGLLLATASTTGSSAMTIVPLSKSAISGPSSDFDLVRWCNCCGVIDRASARKVIAGHDNGHGWLGQDHKRG